MSITDFARDGFVEGSAPHLTTLKKRIERGVIPGEIQGTRYYVWVGPHLELMEPGGSTGDALADALLNEWQEERQDGEEAA